MKNCFVYLENGLFFEAKSFGASGTKVAKLVINSSLVGYEETVFDKDLQEKAVLFTMTEIGNVGVNRDEKPAISIVLARNYQSRPSNFKSLESLGDFLEKHEVLGVFGIDTREIVKNSKNGIKIAVSTEISSPEELAKLIK